MTTSDSGRVLLIGASRGLGLALAEKWAGLGRHVTATVRGSTSEALTTLAERHDGRVAVETGVDVTEPDQLTALADRLAGQVFDLLFVSAGIASEAAPVGETPRDEFERVMVTNAWGPMRALAALEDLVTADGTIAVMSSGQGSVANNQGGGDEVYRGSKAALNTFMRSYAARHADGNRPLVLMAPGWVRTAMGGAGARYSVDESVAGMTATIDALRNSPGLHYVDLHGRTVPW